jgi:two-component system, cell cycle response regulator DivK
MIAMAEDLILIVEDNARNMKLTRDVLQFHGFRTLEATTGEDGITLAQTERPDLILMDIQLPGMDGVTALGRLRSDPRTAPIPVVAVTAYAMKDDRQRFLQAGFDDCLMKPISVRELPAQVHACLEAARAAEDGA